MRIRKNMNLTPSMIWSTAATPECPEPPPELMQPHICVLNRIPWEVPLSPPRSHQLQAMEQDDSYPNISGTFLSDDSLPPAGHCSNSMKISSDKDITGAIILNAGSGSGDGQIATRKESATPALPSATRKTNNNNDNDNNKKNTEMEPPKRRGRPRKPQQSPLATSSNPYEFYYYSGFGPRWGKRRGGDQKSPDEEDHAIADGNTSRNKKKGIGYGGSSSSYSQVEETDEELDFIYDDFDDDDDDDEYGGPRKRVRKPVKARSLKSLM